MPLESTALKAIHDGKALVYFDPHGLDAPAIIDSIPTTSPRRSAVST